ncbi:flagellar basal body stator protein MotB [Edaphobacter acidisoli]|uniref:Flagellar basal body stator protein MotB n=1 Tax=Edaphobacter acidisoli TaxID=2040573 RepID=A0A916W193_9BACT|nr:flagellar motor protein MotB [Edaphobacter acidisoli]GGA59502.1 flagellar basal body stator protein MotB [Edaphobacter acidisoli]
MSRKKKQHEHVNHERWLVSYADFITLLFAFFVVLFASSQSDKHKQQQLSSAMQSAFQPLGVFEAHSKTPPLIPGGAATNAAPLALPVPVGRGNQHETLEETQRRLSKFLAQQISSGGIPPGSVTMQMTAEGLVISLHEAGFFASGSAEVRTQSIPTLQRLAEQLPAGPLRIEGHTDNIPIHNSQYATNWELSTARATSIARLLLSTGHIDPANVAAAGYAEYHPIASNATEAGRAQNRRVDIILLRHPASSP